MKKLLNVGGGSKAIPLPPMYAGYEHHLLDIDPKCRPDVVCDGRQLTKLPAGGFDVVYCSHNLEHYFRHDVPKVLGGFLHVLNPRGFAHIFVPDLAEVMRTTLQRGLDIDDVLYQSAVGPIRVLDVFYGFAPQIEKSGDEFFAHKTGFTQKSLVAALLRVGFKEVFSTPNARNFDVQALAFKESPDPETRRLFNLPAAR